MSQATLVKFLVKASEGGRLSLRQLKRFYDFR